MLLELWLRNVRNLMEGRVRPGSGLNVFVGANGSGKTSLLEACHVLALGRSFRTHRLARVVRGEASDLAVAADLEDGHHGRSRVAVEWSGERRCRVNGQWMDGHWEIARRLPLVAVHADSFELLVGPPEERRRLLDWGGFYVDKDFAAEWRAWRRAHEQRNAALRQHDEGSARQFEVIAASAGTRLTRMRARFVEHLAEHLQGAVTEGLREGLQGGIDVSFRQGWPEGEGLAAALARSRPSDLERGFGQTGPQKADLDIRVAGRSIREGSRGEQKRVLNALVVAQGKVLMARAPGGLPPLLLLDDAVAEMDETGLVGIMSVVAELGWQCLATTVDQAWASEVIAHRPNARMFHVEHGVITQTQ
ncbi:DNA replication/repair protein RecF [Thioalkalivibrio sp.]|uniref:DNA replication/repair protein RecF n=1 Tax=Thioalkalivibrio sp. TaxID=2093813 RepID=UPI0039747F31